MDIHQAGSVPVLGHPSTKAAARARSSTCRTVANPILPLDASPLASAMSTCAALMELLGKPSVDPATPRGSWHASPEVTRLPSVRQTRRRHKLQRPSVTGLAR